MTRIYDRIGTQYARRRQADPRIAAAIHAALGPAQNILNVGAGTGSYEPDDRQVTALEPSPRMIGQRRPGTAACLRGEAEHLPFADKQFDAVMAVLTVHHWSDQRTGLKQLKRVSRGPVVILTYDPAFTDFWLTDYIPGLITLDQEQMPDMGLYEACLGPIEIRPVPIPHDCLDGFLCANWRHPEAYLDPDVRAGISSFWKLGNLDEELRTLERDLETGSWARRHGHLRDLDALDCGYRLVVAG
jgi:SAM-dependent methyltransferase